VGALDPGMTHDGLEDDEVRIALKRMACEGVAKCVGRQTGDAQRTCLSDDGLEDLLGSAGRQPLSLLREEERRLAVCAQEPLTEQKPLLDAVGDVVDQRQGPLSPTLAVDLERAVGEVHIREVDGQSFSKAKPDAVQQPEEQMIPDTEHGAAIDPFEQAMKLRGRRHLHRSRVRLSGALQAFDRQLGCAFRYRGSFARGLDFGCWRRAAGL